MGGRRARQLAHVLERRLALQAVGALVLAQCERRSRFAEPHGAFACTGISSVIASIRACSSTEIAVSSPRIQARL